MMNWVLDKAKAFVAAIAVGVVPVFISAFEQTSGFDVPAAWEQALLAAVTGLFVYGVSNNFVLTKKP